MLIARHVEDINIRVKRGLPLGLERCLFTIIRDCLVVSELFCSYEKITHLLQ
jgi:hypothetical protein